VDFALLYGEIHAMAAGNGAFECLLCSSSTTHIPLRFSKATIFGSPWPESQQTLKHLNPLEGGIFDPTGRKPKG
jgi:hypothetical protein